MLFPLTVSSAFGPLYSLAHWKSFQFLTIWLQWRATPYWSPRCPSYCMKQPKHVMISFPFDLDLHMPRSNTYWPQSVHLEPFHLWISQTSPLALAPPAGPAGPPHCSWFQKGESGLGVCSEPLGQGWIHLDLRGLMEVYNSHRVARGRSLL